MSSPYSRSWHIDQCVSHPQLIGQTLVGMSIGWRRTPTSVVDDRLPACIWFTLPTGEGLAVPETEDNLTIREAEDKCYDMFNRELRIGDVVMANHQRRLILSMRASVPYGRKNSGYWCQQFRMSVINVETGRKSSISPYQSTTLLLIRNGINMVPAVPPEIFEKAAAWHVKNQKKARPRV